MNMERRGLREIHRELSRRDLLRLAGVGLSGLGLAAIVGCGDGDNPRSATSTPGIVVDPPPETTRIRLTKIPSICLAPAYLAEEFLAEEGFTDVQYAEYVGAVGSGEALSAGEVDIVLTFVGQTAVALDEGDPLVVLGGAHVGCWELFATDRVQSIRDLEGKTISVLEVDARSGDYGFLSSVVGFVGIDVADINFEPHPRDEAIQLLQEGKIDAYMAFPPANQELRAKGIGHVVLNSMMDRPWSQYYCCLVTANKDFALRNPVATKRALRAILKGADLCFREPERAARLLVDKGYTDNYDYALATMKMIPFGVWREFDPEDTLRFYSLRLNEAGIIKSNPDEIIARGTDWRYFNELRLELKG